MKLRLTNEDNWAHEFDVRDALDLVQGARLAWDAFVAAGWPGETTRVRVLGQAPGVGDGVTTWPYSRSGTSAAVGRW